MSDKQRESVLELAAEVGIHYVDHDGDTYEFDEDAVVRFADTLRAMTNEQHASQATAVPSRDHWKIQNETPHDAVLAAAIARAADQLRFDNRPGSIKRQCTLGLFVAALSDRLALAFPRSADALRAVVFTPATSGNPTNTTQT